MRMCLLLQCLLQCMCVHSDVWRYVVFATVNDKSKIATANTPKREQPSQPAADTHSRPCTAVLRRDNTAPAHSVAQRVNDYRLDQIVFKHTCIRRAFARR